MAYGWPGNARELENLCRRVTVLAPGKTATVADLPAALRSGATAPVPDWQASLRRHVAASIERGESPLLARLQPQFEWLVIETALAATGGHKQEAARRLGWGRNTLARKMKDLGLA